MRSTSVPSLLPEGKPAFATQNVNRISLPIPNLRPKAERGQHCKYLPLAFTPKLLFVPAKFRPMLPVSGFLVEGIEPRDDLHVRFQLSLLFQT